MIRNKQSFFYFLMVAVLSILFLFIQYIFFTAVGNPFQKALDTVQNTYGAQVKNALHIPQCANCNIILISLDTLNPDHLPCYGYDRNTAPHLCKYVQDNIQFTHTYANATYTLPSHVSIFTGLLPSQHKITHTGEGNLSRSVPFLPEILQKNGYKTYFFLPFGSDYFPFTTVYNRGISSFSEAYKPPDWEKALRTFAQNSEKGIKTFLFLHTYYVHDPYLIGDEKPIYADKIYPNIPLTREEFDDCSPSYIKFIKEKFAEDIDNGFWGKSTAVYKQYLQEIYAHADDPAYICNMTKKIGKFVNISSRYSAKYYWYNIDLKDQGQMGELRALYDQKINQLDKSLKDVFSFVQNEKYKNNTIVIITSDHGEEFMEHNEYGHTTLYDSNIHVLLTMKIPGIQNKVVSSLTESADITPTILDIVGIKPNSDFYFQGTSLVDTVFGKPDPNKVVVSEGTLIDQVTIRNAEYKLFTKVKDNKWVPYELYNTKKDPKEMNNILFQNPDMASKLLRELTSILSK